MYTMVLYGAHCLYIKQFVHGQTERTVGQLNFWKYEFLHLLIFLYLSYYYNYLIINYLLYIFIYNIIKWYRIEIDVYTKMHLSYCPTVLLFATPFQESLLPYKAFHTLAQLFACYEILWPRKTRKKRNSSNKLMRY